MKTRLAILAFLSCALYAKAQLNIVSGNNGIKEYTAENAQPYDSLTNVENYAALPGQILYMHGAGRNDRGGYYEAFFTGNFIMGKASVYKADNTGNTSASEVEGKYYQVVKAWVHTVSYGSASCLLLREKNTGDEIYYKPSAYPRAMTCLGFYEKLKRYIGQTFLSLALPVETADGQVITPAEGAEFRCADVGLKMNSDGAFLIMESADGIRVEAFPIGDEVYEFVSISRIVSMVKRYGKKYGERIAFRKVVTGMTAEMAVAAWGKPYRMQRTERTDGTYEYWNYSHNRYVEIKDGVVSRVSSYQ